MDSKKVILDSLKYIDNNLERQLKLLDISTYMGYSEYHFSRLFKNYMGVTVMEYVKKRKLITASEEILKGDKIIDVALNKGYMSHGGFTKAFKQEFGFAPALLRAMVMQVDYLEGGKIMSHVFMEKTEEHATKEDLFEKLKGEINKQSIEVYMVELEDIYKFACQSYKDIKRYSGDEYLTHPLNVAIILVQMGAAKEAIFAGMLCDILVKTDITQEIMSKMVSPKVMGILTELKNFDGKQMELGENENVIMVKLAERLHNMRTVEYMDEKSKVLKARETIELFIPIANKLGNNKLVAELNDLSLLYIR